MASTDQLQHLLTGWATPFAVPIWFGKRTPNSHLLTLRNGTGALLALDGRYLATTCHHVVEEYRTERSSGNADFFYIADVTLDPETAIVDEDSDSDLITLDISGLVGRSSRLASVNFFSPPRWPPAGVEEGDLITFVGFPGEWREQVAASHVNFHSFAYGGIIDSTGATRILTRLLLEQAKIIVQTKSGPSLVGGISGAPVFVWRLTPVMYAELVGFVTDHQDNYDLLLIQRAAFDIHGRFARSWSPN